MGLIITIAVVAIAITCFSIELRLRKTSEQNEKIIELLKELK